MSAIVIEYREHPAPATFAVEMSNSKSVVKVVGAKVSVTSLPNKSPLSIGHSYGGRLLAGSKIVTDAHSNTSVES